MIHAFLRRFIGRGSFLTRPILLQTHFSGESYAFPSKMSAVRAHGSDDYPNRKLRYAADELAMDFDDDGLAKKIAGNHNASLISTTDASETTVTADRVDLDFQTDGAESVLTQVAANGNRSE